MAMTRKEFDEIAAKDGLFRDGDEYLIVGTDIRLQHEIGSNEHGKKSQAVARGYITEEIVNEYLNRISAFSLWEPALDGEVTKTQEYLSLFACKQILEQQKLPRGLSDMFPPEDSDEPKEIYSRLPIPNKAALPHFIAIARHMNHIITVTTVTK